MAIRRPSINSPTWIYQDRLYLKDGNVEYRYVLVKWDGVVYERESQTFDYSNPPFVGDEQRGGSIVGRIDYVVEGSLVTIESWEVNWRDEWPLRLAVNYIAQCLYPFKKGFTTRVTKEAYAFWASEQFSPINNLPDSSIFMGAEDDFREVPYPEYMYYLPPPPSPLPAPLPPSFTVVTDPTEAIPGNKIRTIIYCTNFALGSPLFWKMSGSDITPAFFTSGRLTGAVICLGEIAYFSQTLEDSLPQGGPYTLTIQVFTDAAMTQLIGTNTVTITNPQPAVNSLQLGAYIDLWQYRNTDAIFPYVFNSGWNPVVRADNIAANALPLLDKFYILSEVQLNGNDSKLYFGNPPGLPPAAQVLNAAGNDWNTNTGSAQGTYVDPTNPDYTYSAWALKNTIAYMAAQNVSRNNFMLCVGGYLLSDTMDLAGASPAQATAAASQIVTLMNLCGAKGVDMDYEPVGIPCNPARIATLMQAVYTAVKAVNPSYEVHLTVIPSLSQIDPDQKIASALACKDYVDQINVMTYDDPSTLGQPDYQPGNISVFNHTGVARSVQSVQWFIDAGVPANKLGMGIAAYARNSASPGAAFTAQNPVVYSQIVAAADGAGQLTNSFPLGRYAGTANIQNPAPTGQGDYYSPLATALWGFDSVDTVQSKVQNASSMGLRAVFMWQISNDYANTSSPHPAGNARANFALLSASREAINNL